MPYDTGRRLGRRFIFCPSWDNNKVLITVGDPIEVQALCCVCWSLTAQLYFLRLPCFILELPGTTLGLRGCRVAPVCVCVCVFDCESILVPL